MSLNWVMLSADKKRFTPLPGEQQLFTSSPRTTLSLKAIPGFPGKDSFAIDCNAGTLFLTNRRIIFLPTPPTPKFQSFSCPLLNLHDTHVAVPWFGANTWTALVQPVAGGNLPSCSSSSTTPNSNSHSNSNNSSSGGGGRGSNAAGSVTAIELKIAFKDGGAFDFHSKFEQLRERAVQAVELARASGTSVVHGDVHLDELPAYEPASAASLAAATTTNTVPVAGASRADARHETRTGANLPPPSDAPPGYEEALLEQPR